MIVECRVGMKISLDRGRGLELAKQANPQSATHNLQLSKAGYCRCFVFVNFKDGD